jgi:hypothetical protein
MRRGPLLASAAAALVAAAWALWPRAPEGVSVAGDGAPAVAAALDLPARAGVDLVLLRRKANLRHLPKVARLCRGRCGPGLTMLRIVGGYPRLVVEMSELEGIAALDRGEPLPRAIVDCVAGAVAQQVAGRPPSGCLGARRTVVALP